MLARSSIPASSRGDTEFKSSSPKAGPCCIGFRLRTFLQHSGKTAPVLSSVYDIGGSHCVLWGTESTVGICGWAKVSFINGTFQSLPFLREFEVGDDLTAFDCDIWIK